ncbi:putative diguanylate cyclase YcdT [Agrobacterium sp. DSM 25558]|uniref:GGDEF domain-containing protein n=1 Tax=Agrobacterium sp. DSM 25558 TaxID=1907665 RepID=UPI0009726365|nr:GGDEF domain-containing protein [Agrobacterium sp. DSM 25558]SCX26966.1 putative diguanylate cyclase YcdT [Agrobacterium sp. DSM 25558]
MTIPASNKSRDTSRSSLIVTKITQFITKMNLAPLPRNYELFFEVLSGHNAAMGHDILALGNAPQQHDIDMIGHKHNLPSFSRMAAAHATSQAATAIEQISARLSAALERSEALLASISNHPVSDTTPEYLAELLLDIQHEQASLHNFVRQGLEKIREQESNSHKLQAASLKDTLTALPNRAAFLAKLAEVSQAEGDTSVCLVLVNIDRFREINEKYGTIAGNKALRRLAALFRKSIKKDDFAARIGGNDFAFLFSGVSQSTAQSIAERLRHTVENLRFATKEGDGEHLTVSMGVAASEGTASAAEFYGHAELALLAARSGARNCVIPYSREVAQRSRNSYLMQIGA